MRRIKRLDLQDQTQKALNSRQDKADARHAVGMLNVESEWAAARKTKHVKAALSVLKTMAGPRERCMYCGDSHGTDIEHFWPKTPYPDRMFRWPNLLLCCTECGRFKGDDFPLKEGAPLLVDPTSDDPWAFLDFDPATGNLVARFEAMENSWSDRGAKTVERLQLDRREALAISYQKTHRRLTALIERAGGQESPDPEALIYDLIDADDHGLLGWLFYGTGQNTVPMTGFRTRQPNAWAICAQAFG